MLRIECQGCHTAAYADCVCPAFGHDPAVAGVHRSECPMADLGATVMCPPGTDCCDGSKHPGVSHDAAANACPADHSSHPCPNPKLDLRQHGIDEDCPGGHHGFGVKDCTVCRPVKIEVMPGSVTVQTVGA